VFLSRVVGAAVPAAVCGVPLGAVPGLCAVLVSWGGVSRGLKYGHRGRRTAIRGPARTG